MEGARRLVRNLCAWLESGHLERGERRETKKRKKRDGEAWPTVWLAGNGVVVTEAVRAAAADVAASRRVMGTRGWRLRMQHIVRGHWRNQACGPQMAQRKRIWIQPYVKGPEGKVAWSHVYNAGKD
jgi:hypothetical protein